MAMLSLYLSLVVFQLGEVFLARDSWSSVRGSGAPWLSVKGPGALWLSVRGPLVVSQVPPDYQLGASGPPGCQLGAPLLSVRVSGAPSGH